MTIGYQKSINPKHYYYSRVLDVGLSMETNLEAYLICPRKEDVSLLVFFSVDTTCRSFRRGSYLAGSEGLNEAIEHFN